MVYQGQIPLETDVLSTNKNVMIAIGKLASSVLGINTLVNGLNATPTSPASMTVQISPGEIYCLQNIDDNTYGSLGSDISHQIIKQGILLDYSSFSFSAPTSTGKSINYLIQAAFQEVDGDAVVLPYYNSANPNQAFAGVANSGASQNTTRNGSISLSIKAGITGTTGSQSTPAADSGYTGLYVVTVSYGQTSISQANIAVVSGAPFITETLTQKISKATADLLYTTPQQVISMIQNYGSQAINLSGSNNVFTGATSPAITSNTSIGGSLVVNFPTSITGPATLDLGGGATPLVDSQGNAFSASNTIAQGTAIIQFNRTTSKFAVIGIGGIDQVARNAAAAAQLAVNAIKFSAADWSVTQVGTNLIFSYQGAKKASLDNQGNLKLVGDIFSNQTI